MQVDARKARLHVEGVRDAVVRGAFIDPRNGRWAYRIQLLGGGGGGGAPAASTRTRIIYPDQIERLEWTVRGEMELAGAAAGEPSEVDHAPPPLLGGGGVSSLGARVLHHAREDGGGA